MNEYFKEHWPMLLLVAIVVLFGYATVDKAIHKIAPQAASDTFVATQQGANLVTRGFLMGGGLSIGAVLIGGGLVLCGVIGVLLVVNMIINGNRR